MTQHELLMLVAAPFLVLGKPLVASLKALPPRWVRLRLRWTQPRWVQGVWSVMMNPLIAWLVHGVVLWVWHIPALFTAAPESEWIHALQHLSFLLSALVFWWAIIHGRNRAFGYGAAVLYMFTTAMHSGLLGALITLANRVWYPDYAGRTTTWGLSPLEDQQLGGLIMWVPACSLYIIAGLAFFAGWLRSSEERVKRWEAIPDRAGVQPTEVQTP
jgi:putative membrane protein